MRWFPVRLDRRVLGCRKVQRVMAEVKMQQTLRVDGVVRVSTVTCLQVQKHVKTPVAIVQIVCGIILAAQNMGVRRVEHL